MLILTDLKKIVKVGFQPVNPLDGMILHSGGGRQTGKTAAQNQYLDSLNKEQEEDLYIPFIPKKKKKKRIELKFESL